MAGVKTANTMSEGLTKILQEIATLATTPDADLQFLTKLQMMITDFLRSGPGGAMAAGGPPQPGQPSPAPMGGPMQGLQPGAPAIDELQRMMQGGGGQ